MKKLTLLLACIMVFASIAAVSASAADASYTAAYAASDIVIDGKADDAAWATATKATAAGVKSSNTGAATAPTFKILHDDTYIYALVEYVDPNGTIEGKGYVDAVNEANDQPVGNDYVAFLFVDADGVQKTYIFNAPAMADGAVSMNLYHSNFRNWHCNIGNGKSAACGYTQVANEEEGPRAVSVRTLGANGASTVVFEMRLLKEMVGNIDDSVAFELFFNDAALVNGESLWTIEAFSWAQAAFDHWSYLDNTANYGTLNLAAKPAGATEDTSADKTEDTTAKQEDTTAKQESTTANEPVSGGSTTAPTTADMGLAAAAVVMAAAAMIVLKKKH